MISIATELTEANKMREKNGDVSLTLGIDLGGTKVETSLVDPTGCVIASHRSPTQPEKGSAGVIADIVECVRGCLGAVGKTAQAAGIGMAGQIEKDTGIVRFAPNLGWHNVPLKASLEKELTMKTRTIRQSVTFKASASEVYEALMDSKKHSKLTGSEVQMSRKVGSKFSVYGGDIQGANLELVPDQKIVQSWRYSDWPENHYSKATFSLKEVPSGTRLTFIQTGVPEEFYDDIKQGWHDYYWQPMKEMLGKQE